MLRVDYKVTYGVIKYKQNDGKVFSIKIHWANALCAFIYHYKREDGTKMAQLVGFFADEQHIKNCENSWGDCLSFLSGKVMSIKLNMYYHKECNVLLKHFVKCGHEVKCYYKEPKTKNK